MLPTVDTVFPAVVPTPDTVFPTVDVTPERSPALAEAMPTSTQTITRERCILQVETWKAQDPARINPTQIDKLCVPPGCLALFWKLLPLFSGRSWVCAHDVRSSDDVTAGDEVYLDGFHSCTELITWRP